MSQDQAARGFDDDDVRSNGWLFILGVAVLAALISLVAHHSNTGAFTSPPAPSAFPPGTPSTPGTPGPSASAVGSAVASAEASPADPSAAVLAQVSGYVSVSEICSPVTDGKTSLTVRFQLANATPLPEQLILMTPELPMGGLHYVRTDLQHGACAHPTGAVTPFASTALPVHGSVIVEMHFTLPKSCPAPYPVQAVATVLIGGKHRQDTVPLYTDLGTVKFDVCRNQPTT